MTNATNLQPVTYTGVVCWRTEKRENGYTFRVFTVGHKVPSVTLIDSKLYPTRAQATGRAKAWALYHRRMAAKQAA